MSVKRRVEHGHLFLCNEISLKTTGQLKGEDTVYPPLWKIKRLVSLIPPNNIFAHTYACMCTHIHHTHTHTHRGLLEIPSSVPERKSSFQIPYSYNWHSIQVHCLNTSPDRNWNCSQKGKTRDHLPSFHESFFSFRIKKEQGLWKLKKKKVSRNITLSRLLDICFCFYQQNSGYIRQTETRWDSETSIWVATVFKDMCTSVWNVWKRMGGPLVDWWAGEVTHSSPIPWCYLSWTRFPWLTGCF